MILLCRRLPAKGVLRPERTVAHFEDRPARCRTQSMVISISHVGQVLSLRTSRAQMRDSAAQAGGTSAELRWLRYSPQSIHKVMNGVINSRNVAG